MTKKWPHAKLLNRIEENAGWMIKATPSFSKIGFGKILSRFVPVYRYHCGGITKLSGLER